MKHAKLLLILMLALWTCACHTFASKESAGTVIARRAQVRSSTAVVAADLKEVVRGDILDILDSATVEDEQWLRVRTRELESIEGWIEARNIMPQEMLERSRQLAKEDEGVPAQATGQLRASTNIRFTPDRTDNQNILMKLESGAQFEIVSWKRVPKSQSAQTAESDDVPKAGAGQQRQERRSAGDEPKEPEETDELWYKVRLQPSFSPAPAGWIFGKQVELTVPSDIIFYRTGREFVAWQRLDEDVEQSSRIKRRDKDAAQDAQPGSWVILEKSSSEKGDKSEVPDFDRIFVLGYDKDRQEHYTAYRSPDLLGYLPLRVDRRGDDKIFTVKAKLDEHIKDVQYKAYLDHRGVLKVESLEAGLKGGRKR